MTVISAGQSAMRAADVSILGGTVVFDDDLQLVKPGSAPLADRPLRDIPSAITTTVKTAEVFMEVTGRYVMPATSHREHDGSVTLLGAARW